MGGTRPSANQDLSPTWSFNFRCQGFCMRPRRRFTSFAPETRLRSFRSHPGTAALTFRRFQPSVGYALSRCHRPSSNQPSHRESARLATLHVVPVSRKEFRPGIILFFGRKGTDALLSFPLFLDGIVSLIRNADARELVLAFLPRIQSEDLILFVLIQTQMTMILDGTIRQLFGAPDQPTLLGSFLAHEQH